MSVTCDDAYECSNDVLSLNSEFCYCNGYQSCKNVYIDGAVRLDCYGSGSCSDAISIETEYFHDCSAYASCPGSAARP